MLSARKAQRQSKNAFRLGQLWGGVQGALQAMRSAPQPIRRSRSALQLEALEPRLLLSADPVVALTSGDDVAVITQGLDVNGRVSIDVTTGGATTTYSDASTGIQSITIQGLEGADTFTIDASVTIDVIIDGGTSFDNPDSDPIPQQDVIIGPDTGVTWSVTGEGSGTGGSHILFSNIESVQAGSGNDTVVGLDYDALNNANAIVEWVIEDDGEGFLRGGFAFSGIEFLQGGTADDIFAFSATGALSTGLDGGASTTDGDWIVGPGVDTEWIVNGPNSGSLGFASLLTNFAHIENLAGGSANDTFMFEAGGSLSGGIDGGGEDYVTTPTDTLDFSGFGSAVTVNLATGQVAGVTRFSEIDALEGSAQTDTLVGPEMADTGTVIRWDIDGADAGEVAGVAFEGFENLTGSDAANDLFSVWSGGSLTGTLDGGSGATDSLRIYDSTDSEFELVNPAGADQSGSATAYGTTIAYAGIDGFSLVGGTAAAPEFSGTIFGDTIIVEDTGADADGAMRVYIEGMASGGALSLDARTLDSLTIFGLAGADTIEVKSLDSTFVADLLIYGNEADSLGITVDDIFNDSVTFSGDIATNGGGIEVYADSVTVNKDVTLDAGAGDIVFRARQIGDTTLENFLPAFGTDRNVSIDISEGASLLGGGIYLITQAEDRDLIAEAAGSDVTNFVIDPIRDYIGSVLALPVKLLIKQSTATVTVGEGATIHGSDTVGIYASAIADASGSASGSIISVGYSRSVATAKVDIASGASIISDSAAVVITSAAEASSSMSAGTSRESEDTPNPGGKQFALALAVSDANVDSRVILAEGATVSAGKTANLIASGDVSSEAEAEAGLFSDGSAGLAFGLQFSDAKIYTDVAGTVISNMDPGSMVKIEIDPTVQLPTGMTDPKDLADPNGEYVGYVDYDNNMIYVGAHGLVDEDTITYTNRYGNSIGDGGFNSLVDGTDYYVITLEDDPNTARDESQWIMLAASERAAIEASYAETLAEKKALVVQLDKPTTSSFAPTAVNGRAFVASDVDADADSLMLRDDAQSPSNFNKFELGQAVVYHQGTSAISGLEDGKTYYVVAATNQTNLSGDTRFANGQLIQLAESENEALAGIAIDIDAPASGASGFSLSAKHVLDSGFATGIGVIAELDAEDKSSATGGLESEDKTPDALKSKVDRYRGGYDTVMDFNAADTLFQKMTTSYRDQQSSAGSGGGSSIAVAGALAFTFAKHDVKSDVRETAVLKSNEDLEVKATISESYQLGAESNVEPQEVAGGGSRGTSADTMVSIAVTVGIFNNTANATVHSDLSDPNAPKVATLDALRATRVISDVTYPYLVRPDTYVPTSAGEFMDALRTDGYGFVTQYLGDDVLKLEIDPTFGLKSWFNTWTTATAKADSLGIAGAINVMSFTNQPGPGVAEPGHRRDDTARDRSGEDPRQSGRCAGGRQGRAGGLCGGHQLCPDHQHDRQLPVADPRAGQDQERLQGHEGPAQVPGHRIDRREGRHGRRGVREHHEQHHQGRHRG